MAPNILTLDNCKGYATEINLMKKVTAIFPRGPEYADRAIICRKPNGQWTAIFNLDKTVGGYIGYYAQHGFMSI